MGLLLSPIRQNGPLAQLVEHLTFNQVVEGSIPSRLTFLFDKYRKSPHRLARPRTPAFHAGDAGSNPAGDAFGFPALVSILRLKVATSLLTVGLIFLKSE